MHVGGDWEECGIPRYCMVIGSHSYIAVANIPHYILYTLGPYTNSHLCDAIETRAIASLVDQD